MPIYTSPISIIELRDKLNVIIEKYPTFLNSPVHSFGLDADNRFVENWVTYVYPQWPCVKWAGDDLAPYESKLILSSIF